MINKEQIQEKLAQVIYPGFTKNIIKLSTLALQKILWSLVLSKRSRSKRVTLA
jgi:hypothetical protein